MLFVWLLALGTGFANACLVQEDHARHGHLVHLGHQDAGVTSMPVSGLDLMDDDHESSPEKKACQNFCAAEQTGVVKPPTDTPAHLDVALVRVSLPPVAPLQADRASQRPDPGDPDGSQPPLFIRFLRLTL
jgi:hypothetical protein